MNQEGVSIIINDGLAIVWIIVESVPLIKNLVIKGINLTIIYTKYPKVWYDM